ncbi:MAG: hypothetical protein ACOCX4_06310 [Planctomycetota bacterium]
MTRTAVAMFSGGLDSCLAAAVVRAQGVRVVLFHMKSVFARSGLDGTPHPEVTAAAEALGLGLHAEEWTDELLGLVRAPAHGLGKHRNPCIDCRIATIRHAEAHRVRIGADFLVSGEVLGQRPMSQNRNAMAQIDKATGLADRLLRPLSARFLDPTLPEREGWVDRDRLPAIRGRGRQEQIRLAAALGVARYGAPAGGCLLTEALFCRKFDDLLAHRPDADAGEMRLLAVGRHFRLDPQTRAVSGRDEGENDWLERLTRPGDRLYQTVQEPGSIILLRTDPPPPGAADAEPSGPAATAPPVEAPDAAAVRTAAGLAVHYSRNRTRGTADVEERAAGDPPGAGRRLDAVESVDPTTLDNPAANPFRAGG